ncbi:MAG: hypothetical protein ACP5D7_01655 [Limnospira sp.]
MKIDVIETFGNWNPQLIRELKGRLKSRTVTLVATVSIVAQGLLMFFFYAQLPTEKHPYGNYLVRPSGKLPFIIDWMKWWNHIFLTLNWILPLALMLGGVYMLIQDLATEERRGTLNFIRLSPQSGRDILIGKVLGVPILLYLGLALALPLQFGTAIAADIPLQLVLLQNGVFAIVTLSLFSLSLLFPLMGFSAAWLGTLLASVAVIPALQFLHLIFNVARLAIAQPDAWQTFNDRWDLWVKWFNIPVSYSMATWYCFMGLTLVTLMAGTWQVLNRRFRDPGTTLISKKQSYFAVFGLNLFLLGFVFPLRSYALQNLGEFFLFGLIPFCLLLAIAALSSQRQPIQDWARYRRESTRKNIKNRQLLQDLLWGEKSPAILAMSVNVAMTIAMWTPWLIQAHLYELKYNTYEHWQGILAVVLLAGLILICAAIAQLILMKNMRKPQIWAAVIIAAILILPPLCLGILQMQPEYYPLLFLLTSLPILGAEYATTLNFFTAIALQWIALTLLTLQLRRQLTKAGESETKRLISGVS